MGLQFENRNSMYRFSSSNAAATKGPFDRICIRASLCVQKLAESQSNTMCICCWCRNSHSSCAPCKRIAQMVCQLLQMIRSEFIILIVQNMIVSWASCSKEACMTAQEEVIIGRMMYVLINYCTWKNISIPHIMWIWNRKETSVLSLLGNYEGDLWVIPTIQCLACLDESCYLQVQTLLKLWFTYAISALKCSWKSLAIIHSKLLAKLIMFPSTMTILK